MSPQATAHLFRRRRASLKKTTAAPSAAGAPQAQVRPHPRVHAPGRQEGHGPARRRVASGPQGRRGAAARRDHEEFVPRAADAGGLARLGHAQREHAALLPPRRKLSGPVRGRGGRARRVPRRRWRLHHRERAYASRVDGVDADATPRRRRRDAAPPRRRLHDDHSTHTQARRPSRPTPTARKP